MTPEEVIAREVLGPQKAGLYNTEPCPCRGRGPLSVRNPCTDRWCMRCREWGDPHIHEEA